MFQMRIFPTGFLTKLLIPNWDYFLFITTARFLAAPFFLFKGDISMIKNQMDILDATRHWVHGFDAFPQSMLSLIIEQNPDAWSEVTLPAVGDSVFVYESSEHGEIVARNDSSYTTSLNNSCTITLTSDDFEVCYDYSLPIWGTLWAFDDSIDIAWLDTDIGLASMSDCGFRIFHHEDFGYFFGIDGAGYDFYSEHWIPLYLARGLHWHHDTSSFEIHDSWNISEVDNLIAVQVYEFSPALSCDDKILILGTMAKNYDPNIGFNFNVLDSVLHSLFEHRLVSD